MGNALKVDMGIVEIVKKPAQLAPPAIQPPTNAKRGKIPINTRNANPCIIISKYRLQ